MIVLTKSDLADLLTDNLAMVEVDMITGRINWASRNLENMFGYNISGALEGEQIEILVSDQLKEKHVEHRAEFNLNPGSRLMGAGKHLALQGQRRDGTIFPVEVMLLAIVFDMTLRE